MTSPRLVAAIQNHDAHVYVASTPIEAAPSQHAWGHPTSAIDRSIISSNVVGLLLGSFLDFLGAATQIIICQKRVRSGPDSPKRSPL